MRLPQKPACRQTGVILSAISGKKLKTVNFFYPRRTGCFVVVEPDLGVVGDKISERIPVKLL